MQFRTDDGRLFDRIEEAKKHEDRLREKEKAEKELEAKKEKRLKEIEETYEKYITLRNSYVEDYGSISLKKSYTYPIDWMDFFG